MKANRPQTIAFIISDIDNAIAFEWIADSLMHQYRLFFILIGDRQSALYYNLKSKNVKIDTVPSRRGAGQLLTALSVFWRLLWLRPSVVHTHLMKANLAGLTAAWLLRIPKRVYTRHHALVHHREHPKGLWQDTWCNFAATHIVAISRNVVRILNTLEKVPVNKIRLIHHGFNLQYFDHATPQSIEQLKRTYKIPSGKPVIGVVARYQNWKGIQYIIPAFKKLLTNYPEAHLILANAFGPYQHEIRKLLHPLPEKSYTEISFESNMPALFHLFDVYVHTPTDEQSEAFGQTYVEALACGIPSIFTLSGVAPEFVKHEENALVVPFCDSESIGEAIVRILNDDQLRKHLIANGKKSATLFPLNRMIERLNELYRK